MPKALVDGIVIAEAEKTLKIEGNHYFPPDSLKKEYFSDPTQLHTVCHWKGQASYRDVEVKGKVLRNVAWFYPDISDDAKQRVGEDFSNYVAFYPQVRITG